jgi:hypothetical protein
MISSMLNEVAALRETVRGLDPTFSEVLEQRREQEAVKQAKVVAAVLRQCDDMLRRLTVGEVC